MAAPIRVGIVGLSPATSHCTNFLHKVPLTSPGLKNKYKIVALSMSSPKKAQESAAVHEVPPEKGYSSVYALVADPDVDLVVISVKVPRRYEMAMAAIEAGKDVYIEWPIAANLAEAEAMAQRAREKGIKSMVGLQARTTPTVLKMKEIVNSGVLGRILTTTLLVADDLFLKFQADKRHSHDTENGANIVTIAGGRLMDAVTYLLGEFTVINASTTMQFAKTMIYDDAGNEKRGNFNDSPDTFMIHGTIRDTIAASVQMYTQTSATPNLFQWIITGEKGALKMEGPSLMIDTIPVKIFQTSEANGPRPVSWEEIVLEKYVDHGAEYHAWADKNDEHIVALDEALVRYRMVDAIFRSGDTGQPATYSSAI